MPLYRETIPNKTKQQLYGHHYPSRKLSKLNEQDMQDIAGLVRTNLLATYTCWPLHMDEQRQDDQQEPKYNTSAPIEDIDLKTTWEQ